MNKRFEWLLLVILALFGLFVWWRLSLPRYQSIDLSISQNQAVEIATQYLAKDRGVNIQGYTKAAMFNVDEDVDRYLQKTIGQAREVQFLKQYHYDLFFWVVRFFKEKQKEEFRVALSSATGEILGYSHTIPDTEARPAVDKEEARRQARAFLQSTYGFASPQYIAHGEDVKKYENRMEYAFTYQNKDVDILWNKSSEEGHARLVTTATVSGHEVMVFAKFQLEIPDGFNRYVDNLKQTGENLTLVFRLFYLALLTIAIVVVVNRKHQVVARSVKPFYVGIGVVIFVLLVLDVLNGYQSILYSYPTTQSLGNFMVSQFIEAVIGPFFIAVAFCLPALAGESLRFETDAKAKQQGFLSSLMSSFYSLSIGRQIFTGYLLAAMILGVQAAIFDLGYKYCGVWDELSWLTQDSTTLVPAFSALVIGFQASFSEEAMFRLFAINLFKRWGFPTLLAVFLGAMMWGFGHTGYEIFPMWFRGVEVTTIGLIMGAFYLRYGLMCVIAAHFVIDSSLTSLPYLLKPQVSFDFCTSCAVILLPLVLGIIAVVFNKHAREAPLKIRFNPQQEFNYKLLLQLCAGKDAHELAILKKDLKRHGWDEAIIQRVFEDA